MIKTHFNIHFKCFPSKTIQIYSTMSSSGPIQVVPHSEEYISIQYLLQLSLQTSKIDDLNVWLLADPEQAVSFENHTTGMLTLDSWVDVTTLNKSINGVEQILSRGLQFSTQQRGGGMKFSTGNIKLNSSFAGPAQFLLTKIGVGRSFVLDEEAVTNPLPSLPSGYDSFYLHSNPDLDGDGKITAEEYEISATHAGRHSSLYQHDYLVLDSKQVLAQYLVHFTATPLVQDYYDTASDCDVCERAPATLYCSTDDASLCGDCDEVMHSSNQFVSKHSRTPINHNMKPASKNKHQSKRYCPMYKDELTHYCQICHVPVSFQCKMVGHHSAGEAASHRLTLIEDSYEAALAESRQSDPVLDSKRLAIRDHLSLIDMKLKEVNNNSAAVEEEIYKLLQDTLFKLQDETQKKLNVLLSEELELRRQYEQLDWVDNFLLQQQEKLSPVEFLSSWNNYTKLRGILQSFKYTRTHILEGVRGDIQLNGNLIVSSESPVFDTMGLNEQSSTATVVAMPISFNYDSVATSMSNNPEHYNNSNYPPNELKDETTMLQPAQGIFEVDGTSRFHDSENNTNNVVYSDNTQKNLDRSSKQTPFQKKLLSYSLKSIAARQKKAYGDEVIDRELMFHNSRILTEFEDAMRLYFTLPGVQSSTTEAADTTLIYSSTDHGRTIEDLIKAISENDNCPTVVLIKSRKYVFGGYASDAWNFNGERFGSAQSFLFSLTHNVKIPYHGRMKDGLSLEKPPRGFSSGPPPTDALRATEDSIEFGIKDLIIKDNLLCSSQLEHSYGLGLKPGSDETNTFLAGHSEFDAEIVEIWKIGGNIMPPKHAVDYRPRDYSSF